MESRANWLGSCGYNQRDSSHELNAIAKSSSNCTFKLDKTDGETEETCTSENTVAIQQKCPRCEQTSSRQRETVDKVLGRATQTNVVQIDVGPSKHDTEGHMDVGLSRGLASPHSGSADPRITECVKLIISHKNTLHFVMFAAPRIELRHFCSLELQHHSG